MKKATMDRIIENGYRNAITTIGKYSYELDWTCSNIIRCLTEDINSQWIDTDGNICTAWTAVQAI